MVRKQSLLLAPAVVAAALLAGCGATTSAGDFKGDEHAVVKAVDDLAVDATSRDAAQICSHDITAALAARIRATAGPGADCAKAVRRQLDDTDNFNVTAEKRGVTISGQTATVRVKDVRAGRTHHDTIKLAREGSAWRVAGLG